MLWRLFAEKLLVIKGYVAILLQVNTTGSVSCLGVWAGGTGVWA